MAEAAPTAVCHKWGLRSWHKFTVVNGMVMTLGVTLCLNKKSRVSGWDFRKALRTLNIKETAIRHRDPEYDRTWSRTFIPVAKLYILLYELRADCPVLCEYFKINQPPVDAPSPIDGLLTALRHREHIAPFNVNGTEFSAYYPHAKALVVDIHDAYLETEFPEKYAKAAAEFGARCIVVDVSNVFDIIAQLSS
jgi:hypothetical protein